MMGGVGGWSTTSGYPIIWRRARRSNWAFMKSAVTIADSPMRVLTGAMSLMPHPEDAEGKPLTNSTTAALDALRFSCTQLGFNGASFGDIKHARC